MTQYISKPVKPTIAEAVKFDTSEHPADFAFREIEAFVGEGKAQRVTPLGGEGYSIFHDGIKHWLELTPGQYVLQTEGGFFYPVAEGVFEHTFSPLSKVAETGEIELDFEVVIDAETGKATVEDVAPKEDVKPEPPADGPVKAPTTRKRKSAAQKAAEAAAE